MTRTVILMPYRSDGGGRRDQLFGFVDMWLRRHHNRYPIYLGKSPDGPFNRGAAINDAARNAGQWDVAVVHDADTLVQPQQLVRGVVSVLANSGVAYPYETYMYLNQESSDHIISHPDGPWFVSPEIHPTEVVRSTVRYHHVSGALAIDRATYDQVGGFIELEGWGAEDLIMHNLFEVFGNGVRWVRGGGAYHLWHPANRNDPKDACNMANHDMLADVMAMAVVPDVLKKYLVDGGHPIP